MPDMMAIVSKAVFEKEVAAPTLGARFETRAYRSANKNLEKLDAKSRLFLVTVRPPDEKLWLVAVLTGLNFANEQWNADPNTAPMTDISGLIPQLTFDSGKGLIAKKGALGMSLQTPRTLAPGDSALLLGAIGGGAAPAPKGPINLTAHEASSPLPCLCKRCFASAGETSEARGTKFIRGEAENKGRVLYYWMPVELADQSKQIAQSVKGSLNRLKAARAR